MKNESYVIRKEQCPECARIGNDRSKDNLGVYSDGHSYCFKCGFTDGRRHRISIDKPQPLSEIVLPHDTSTDLPVEARMWLSQYELKRIDIEKHNILWSEHWSRIIFPYFDETGLIAWQGRYVGTDKRKAKWFSQGKIHEIIHTIQVNHRKAILVEDIVSAIKVSKFTGAIPLFGSSLSANHILRLKHIVDEVWIWLDPDMRGKSIKLMQLCNILNLYSHVIFSDKDPKAHTYVEVQEILNEAL